MKHEWQVGTEDAGQRLDVFLAARLASWTRSGVAKRLKQGAGKVNGKTAAVHQFLKAGNRVEFEEAAAKNEVRVESLPPLEIIDETADWMVINKPAGLLVHPDVAHPAGTLVDLLIEHHPPIARIGEDPRRPGIMHRLDKEVGGLMVVAKTQAAFDDLKRQFAAHSVTKKYIALVHGALSKDEGDIKLRIARSRSRSRMAAIPEKETAGKAAWTHYRVLRRFRGATLLELSILSGRTHQIRAHMHGLGHPVIGDPLYTARRVDRNIQSQKLLLQSIELEFTDPVGGERKRYALPPDPTFEALIKNL